MGSDPFITAVEGKNHRFWLRLPRVGGLTPLNQQPLTFRVGIVVNVQLQKSEPRNRHSGCPVAGSVSQQTVDRVSKPGQAPLPLQNLKEDFRPTGASPGFDAASAGFADCDDFTGQFLTDSEVRPGL
jgi:hypothetical protein